jgi:hypothetical protein
MALLTDEQITELVNILLDERGPVLTGDELLEQIGLLLEDISGFETAPAQAVDDVVAQVRSRYMKQATSTPTNPSSENPPKNDVAFKKAIALGKEMMKKGEVTKADIARKMFELIKDEPRDVVVQAFIDGAGLTPKGASTYYYNVKRKFGRG